MSAPVNVEYIDELLAPYRDLIGGDYPGYRNHCLRMAGFCLLLRDCSAEEQRKIEIAAAFHDIGLWTEGTLDYLSPSVPPALKYLDEQGLVGWGDEIAQMIVQHHKIRPVSAETPVLVEVFRQGDLVDFSLGMVKFGLSRAQIKAMKKRFPNSGFHKTLMRMLSAWFVRHPLNPMPMMKW